MIHSYVFFNSLHLVRNLLFKIIFGMIVDSVFTSHSIIKEGECSMKKMMVLLASVLVLTACAQPKKEMKKATADKTEKSTKVSSSAKEEKGLKFVVAPQYEGKTSDLIELGKKLVKEHPEAGKQGEITLYYTGSTYTLTQQEYVVFMLVNKTTTNIDHDATLFC